VLQVGDGSHARSYALFRIESLPEDRHEVLTALGSAGACVIDESASSVVAEATGTPDQIDALFTRLARFTIAEAARTPAMALHTPSADPQPQGET
jgi:acetolactate synthase-1/3 small subunit